MCILNLDYIIKNDAGKYTCYKKVDDEVSKEVTEIFVISKCKQMVNKVFIKIYLFMIKFKNF